MACLSAGPSSNCRTFRRGMLTPLLPSNTSGSRTLTAHDAWTACLWTDPANCGSAHTQKSSNEGSSTRRPRARPTVPVWRWPCVLPARKPSSVMAGFEAANATPCNSARQLHTVLRSTVQPSVNNRMPSAPAPIGNAPELGPPTRPARPRRGADRSNALLVVPIGLGSGTHSVANATTGSQRGQSRLYSANSTVWNGTRFVSATSLALMRSATEPPRTFCASINTYDVNPARSARPRPL